MGWSKGFFLLLMTAGFAKLSITLLNTRLARPQPKWMIGFTELVQLLLIPVYTWLLSRTFVGDSWADAISVQFGDISAPIRLVLTLAGVVGLGQLIYAIVAHQRYRPASCQLSNHSQIIDFRQQARFQPWSKTLVGQRPMRTVALLPGNEQFTVEVSTRQYELPRLPKEWDGLSIVHLADTHFRGAATRDYFQAVFEQIGPLNPDLIVFTGDTLDDAALIDWLPETFGRLQAPLGCYFILGNHDWYLGETAIRQKFVQQGWIDLAGRVHQLSLPKSGPDILIAGDETPWMGSHPDIESAPGSAFRILVSHTPDNIAWARDHNFDLMFAGHTHGGQIRLPLIGPVYSPSRYGCRYASGVFWLEPTLMYVSRGISGREPVRYNCRPELTKVVLRSAPSD